MKEAGGSDPVTPETLFGVGSLTKGFTATLIAMLVDEGRIGWDDPVVRHLPGFAMHDAYVTRHLTVRDALSHRTGLAGDDLMWVAGARDPAELVRRLRYQTPAFGFRARFGYHNVMCLVAGELAEEVTGDGWEELVRRRIFEPLGMSRSTAGLGELRRRSDVALPPEEIGPGQLLGTVPSATVPLDAPTEVRRIDWFDPVTAPAGGIASSAKEFGAWLRFHLGAGKPDGRRLLSAEALLETRTPQTPLPGFSRNQSGPSETNLGAYGMGWGVRDAGGSLGFPDSGHRALSSAWGMRRDLRRQPLSAGQGRVEEGRPAPRPGTRPGRRPRALGGRHLPGHLGSPEFRGQPRHVPGGGRVPPPAPGDAHPGTHGRLAPERRVAGGGRPARPRARNGATPAP